jgi:hypothetical protein
MPSFVVRPIRAMKSFYILSILAGLACAGSAQAQPHVLSEYLSTNRPGVYPLSLVWTGTQKITFQTGYYKYGGRGAMTVPEEDWIRFDRFSTQIGRGWFGRQVLDDSTATNVLQKEKLYGYEAALPSDAELTGVHDASTFTNLFKLDLNTFIFPSGPQSGAQRFHFYSLGTNNTIEVMEVFAQETTRSNIQVVLVKRGVLYPTKKP